MSTHSTKPRPRVLITGGGSGIGLKISEHFIESGCDVVIHYASSGKSAEQMVSAAASTEQTVVALHGDFSQPADAEKVTGEAIQSLGGLDVLINNAAWDPGANPLETTDTDFIQKILTVNVTAPLLCIRAAAAALAQSPSGGSVINIGSVQSSHSLPGHAAYAASKGALDSLTKQLSIELGDRNIRVNSINPGFICIERTTEGKSEEELARRAARIPLKRLGSPQDVVGVISMLCSQESAYLTGQIITVDGGSIRLLPSHTG